MLYNRRNAWKNKGKSVTIDDTWLNISFISTVPFPFCFYYFFFLLFSWPSPPLAPISSTKLKTFNTIATRYIMVCEYFYCLLFFIHFSYSLLSFTAFINNIYKPLHTNLKFQISIQKQFSVRFSLLAILIWLIDEMINQEKKNNQKIDY